MYDWIWQKNSLLEQVVDVSVKIEIYSVTEHSYGINCIPICDCKFCKKYFTSTRNKASDIFEVYSVAVYFNGFNLNCVPTCDCEFCKQYFALTRNTSMSYNWGLFRYSTL